MKFGIATIAALAATAAHAAENESLLGSMARKLRVNVHAWYMDVTYETVNAPDSEPASPTEAPATPEPTSEPTPTPPLCLVTMSQPFTDDEYVVVQYASDVNTVNDMRNIRCVE